MLDTACVGGCWETFELHVQTTKDVFVATPALAKAFMNLDGYLLSAKADLYAPICR